MLCVLQMGNSDDVCDLALSFCKYDLFVLSWASV